MNSRRPRDRIATQFGSLPDPRRALTRCDQSAHGILKLALLAVIVGATRAGWSHDELLRILQAGFASQP